MVLEDLQRQYASALDEELIARVSGQTQLPSFYGMMQYQLGFVDKDFNSGEARSGKRFRPLLCLLSCEGVGGTASEALPAAAGIQILHDFSLVHDDIEDKDELRRHRETLWKIWGEPQAINVGDAMLALAGRAILNTPGDPVTVVALANAFQDACVQLTEGQHMDMTFQHREDISVAEYMSMIERKTASLIGFSLWCGAVIGRADSQTREELRAFGLDVGKAFQIRDDILGIWGTRDVTGKDVDSDLSNRKKTLPIIIAMSRTGSKEREALVSYFRRNHEDVGSVLAGLDASGCRAECERQMEHHLTRALRRLEGAAIRPEARAQFGSIARHLLARPS